MKKFERKIGVLTEGQLKVFHGLEHCLKAARFCIEVTAKAYDQKYCELETARDFIKQVLHELEDRKKLEYEMWDKLRKQYNLTDEEFVRCHINPDNGDINIYSKEYYENSQSGKLDLTKFGLIWSS
jgi:hypothetical protein